MKRMNLVMCLVIGSTLCGFTQTKSAAMKKSMHAVAAPDRAYLQKIWDGWATLNPDNVAQYYASGPNAFFDIAPLTYSGWDEYKKSSKAPMRH